MNTNPYIKDFTLTGFIVRFQDADETKDIIKQLDNLTEIKFIDFKDLKL